MVCDLYRDGMTKAETYQVMKRTGYLGTIQLLPGLEAQVSYDGMLHH
jgi:hypothetical protein